MGPFNTLTRYRRRFNELAYAVSQGRELSRSALQEARELRLELIALRAGHEALQAHLHDLTDWGRMERMLRAGVRVGMIDEIVADYYPGMLGVGAE